ncbi:hypothetical protein [Yoonia sp. SS1-5]|uniref:Uncharacterized protein n=1 Tax=Yoonia rhodophyticola TaxID=3137370 RepID=A0AAN0MC85_9RHOB
MNKLSNDAFGAETAPVTPEPQLTQDELQQLRAILQVVQYDAPSETLRIAAGKARLLVRKDGSVRIEGKRVTAMSHGTLVLNGAAIELN